MAWAYKGTITITNNATLLPSTQTNFPVLIKLDSVNSTVTGTNRIKTVANGGAVNNTGVQSGGNAVTMPFDLAFYSDTNLTVKIPWEVESYDGTGGTLWAWVLVASCSLSANLYFGLGDATIATQQNTGSLAPTAVWDANFKAVWHIPNGVTLSLSDSTSNANTLVLPGQNPTAATGQVDGGANFVTGSLQYLSVTNALQSVFNAQLTAEAWIKPTQSGFGIAVMGVWQGGTNTSNEWLIYTGQDISNRAYSFLLMQSDGTQKSVAPTTPTYTDGTWHHIAAVADGSFVRLYVDGASIGTPAAYNGTIRSTGTTPLFVGKLGGNAYYWNGGMDEIRLSTIGRSADWIQATYNATNAPQTFAAVSVAAFVPATAATLEDHISGGSQSTVTIREVTIGDFN